MRFFRLTRTNNKGPILINFDKVISIMPYTKKNYAHHPDMTLNVTEEHETMICGDFEDSVYYVTESLEDIKRLVKGSAELA